MFSLFLIYFGFFAPHGEQNIPCTATVPKNVASIYRGGYIASTHKGVLSLFGIVYKEKEGDRIRAISVF